ncbi:MAG: TonB-dependent receptor [Acidobacteria bacterium]|nr:TonB-dependent receptor [Acidobacteriota bacterium]
MCGRQVVSWRCSRCVAVLLVVGLGMARPAATQVTSGAILGAIVDAQGGVLPGVTVTARNIETGVSRTSVTDGTGLYRLAGLPVGRYELAAELPGFATLTVPNLTITINLELRRDLTMTLEGVQETVTVSGAAPIIDTATSAVAAVVTQEQIQTLPIPDQQPMFLATLMPGTSTDTMRDRRTAATVGSAASHNATAVLVDGLMNRSLNAGDAREDLPQAAIREFTVNVSQAGAEFGGTTGGVVSIVTRSGTNQWHGEVFEWFRDKSLNRMDLFEERLHKETGVPKAAYRRHLYGGAVGGPIIRDRAHFFVAGQKKPVTEVLTISTGRPEFYSSVEGAFENETETNLFFLRGDLKIAEPQSLFVRYNYYRDFADCEDCGGTTAANGARESPRPNLSAGHTWVLGSRAVNEARFMHAILYANYTQSGREFWKGEMGDFNPSRLQALTPVFVFPSLTWGTNRALNRIQEFWEFRDDFAVSTGRHNWKFGFDYLNMPGREEANVGSSLGTWTFAQDQLFNPNDPASLANLRNPIQFTATFPAFVSYRKNRQFQVYLQDDWRPQANLTFNLGVRYDLQKDSFNEYFDVSEWPRPIPFVDPKSRGDYNNVSPRLGVNWDLSDNGVSIVRAGYGIYYGYMQGAVQASEANNLKQHNINLRNPSHPDPYGGLDPLTFATVVATPNINTIADDIRNPAAHTGSVGFSRALRSDMAIHLDAVYTKTMDYFSTRNINTPDPVTGRRQRSEWGRIIENGNENTDVYKAFFVRLDKRYSNNYLYMLSYTLSKRDNDIQGTNSGAVTDFFNPRFDWGPGSTDRRHSFVASGSVMLPHDVNLGGVWTLRSSMPFSARAGIDLNRDGANTDYVPGTTRNQGNRNLDIGLVNAWRAQNGRQPISADRFDSNRVNNVDVRVSKAFRIGGDRRLELVLQVFNVFGCRTRYRMRSASF